MIIATQFLGLVGCLVAAKWWGLLAHIWNVVYCDRALIKHCSILQKIIQPTKKNEPAKLLAL
jgi:hypothetical protein